jgi:hypothetical protein
MDKDRTLMLGRHSLALALPAPKTSRVVGKEKAELAGISGVLQ